MLRPEMYKEWANVSWRGSYYEGKWAKGETIRFISPGHGGTMAQHCWNKSLMKTFLQNTLQSSILMAARTGIVTWRRDGLAQQGATPSKRAKERQT
jgi:hypothetical protein